MSRRRCIGLKDERESKVRVTGRDEILAGGRSALSRLRSQSIRSIHVEYLDGVSKVRYACNRRAVFSFLT